MSKYIIFFNNFHNGDVYLNLQFIEHIAKNINQDVYFITELPKNLTKNYKTIYLNFDEDHFIVNLYKKFVKKEMIRSVKIIDNKECILINTLMTLWKCCYDDNQHLNLDGHLRLYNNKIFPLLKVNKNFDIKDFLYESYVDENIFNQYEILNNKDCILILNGNVHSKQVKNFNMDKIISLMKNYGNVVVSHHTEVKDVFIFEKHFPFSKEFSNLPILSKFSERCKLILGRDSGLFQWCLNKNNINVPNICISSVDKYIPLSKIYNTCNIKYDIFCEINVKIYTKKLLKI